ncbi:hypothetical protein OF83DRAFT_1114849 [Amylostereum chailletii]|nr:hypothetical protein OF83DRAFT_1114849 [Amylostereum chailletii]
MPPRLTRCPELSRLPPSPTPLRNVNFRRTTPGSAPPMIFLNGHQPQHTLFDPTHPFASIPSKIRTTTAPRFAAPALTVRAFPKAFLSKPEIPFPSPPYKTTPYPEERHTESRKVDMSFVTIAYERQIVLSDVLRTRVKRRLKEAVRLIVTRGARMEQRTVRGKEEKHVVFDDADSGVDRWIIPGELASFLL